MFDVKGHYSASKASELAGCISLECKANSTFLLSKYRVALLRHPLLMKMVVVPSKSGRLNGLAVSMGWPSRWGNTLSFKNGCSFALVRVALCKAHSVNERCLRAQI